jgi:hypothetical protein
MRHSVTVVFCSIAIILALILIFKVVRLRKFSLTSHEGAFYLIDRFLIAFSLVTIFIALLSDFNFLQYEAPIPHSSWSTITFADFKALKKPEDKLNGRTEIGTISTWIKVKKHKNSIDITAYFYPSRSYVYYKRLFSNVLLKHEMYHFHITEYHARLLRKEISYLPDSLKLKNLNKIRRRILDADNYMQYLYDKESAHSNEVAKQIEWQNKIDSLLLSVKEFSNTNIPLSRKH